MKSTSLLSRFLVLALSSLFFINGTDAQEGVTEDPDSIPIVENTEKKPQSTVSVRHRLKPPDRSSPRATLNSFLQNLNRSYRMLMEAHQENIDSPGLFITPDSIKLKAEEAEVVFIRAARCLDLREIPSKLKRDERYEKTIMLKEIFDRIELPPLEEIPDAEMVDQEIETKKYPKLDRWKIPNTDITIARVEEGPREGEYLFSPLTVARIGSFYRKVEDQPYKENWETSDGFFHFYISTSGRLLPPKYERLIPSWSKEIYFSQTIWQWFYTLVWFILIGITIRLLFLLLWKEEKEFSHWRRIWGKSIFLLAVAGLLTWLNYIIDERINLTGPTMVHLNIIFSVLYWILVSIAVLYVGRALAESIIVSTKMEKEGIRASYYRAVFGVIGFVGSVILLVYGLSTVGVALTPLLAGVGIGSLAVALAVRPALESIVASLTILLERPYQLGDYIKTLGEEGTVVSVGLRSTKLRISDGPIISIPNEKIVRAEVTNTGKSPFYRRKLNLLLSQDMATGKIIKAVEILKEITAVPGTPESGSTGSGLGNLNQENKDEVCLHPNVAINQPGHPPRVFFDNFNAGSLNILVLYWYHPRNYWDFLQHSEYINTQITERFNREGIVFARPTHKLYLARDEEGPFNLDQMRQGD